MEGQPAAEAGSPAHTSVVTDCFGNVIPDALPEVVRDYFHNFSMNMDKNVKECKNDVAELKGHIDRGFDNIGSKLDTYLRPNPATSTTPSTSGTPPAAAGVMSVIRDNLPAKLGFDAIPSLSSAKATAKSKTKKGKQPAAPPVPYQLSKAAITKLNKVVENWIDNPSSGPEPIDGITFVRAKVPGNPYAIREDQWPRFLAAFRRKYEGRVKGNSGQIDLVDVAAAASVGVPSASV